MYYHNILEVLPDTTITYWGYYHNSAPDSVFGRTVMCPIKAAFVVWSSGRTFQTRSTNSLFLFSSVFIHLYGCFVDILKSKADIFYDYKEVYLKEKSEFSFISSKDYSHSINKMTPFQENFNLYNLLKALQQLSHYNDIH